MKDISKLKEYDKMYYNEGTSPISDEEYDKLKEEIEEQYPNDPYFDEVGHVISEKVKLPYILGSLDKVKYDSIDKWIEDHPGEYIISQKMDGVSMLIIYRNGEVQFASTRGDGEYGKDITEKAKIFCPHIENGSIIILRGEALLINDIHKELGFSTPRNGTAGILNRDDNQYSGHITPYFYELIRFADLNMYTEYERFVLIESIGLNVPKWKLLNEFDLNEVLSLMVKESYDIDGVVISVNKSERENVKHPKNKVAFKVQGEIVESKVADIEWNVSRTGKIVPVIIIEPISIGGVTINRTSGFNAEFIISNRIVKGNVIKLIRSGDVIPYIVEVEKGSFDSESLVPLYCPSCDSELSCKGVNLICPNKGCTDRSFKEVEYFLRTLGAENITSKTLEKLIIADIPNAYELDEFFIANMEGFGIRSGQIIVGEIQKTLKTTQEKLLQAFGIPGVGPEISKSLLRCFGTIENVLKASVEELQQCEGVGPKISENIIKEVLKYENLYKYLKNIGMEFVEGGINNMLNGKQFALTGKGPMSRDKIISLIEGVGGLVKGINKSTDYLVTSDPDSDSGKTKKAKQYGVKIISYENLLEMIK